MRRLRKAVRLLAMIVTAVVFLPLLLFYVALGERTTRRRSKLLGTWSRALVRILGGRLVVRGRPPEAPFFLVSNHLGYTDIIVLGALLPGVFVAKSEVAGWPVLGPLCRWFNTVFVDRNLKRDLTRANEQIDRILDVGFGVVIFPEGTSTPGREVLPFRPGLLEPAARRDLGVSYATIGYTTPPGELPAETAICWWGDMTFGPHFLDLLGLAGFTATIIFGPEPIREEDRRRLAVALHQAVAGQLSPVASMTSPPRPGTESPAPTS